ncbi:MAG: TlpA family protein disulfide reductase [Solirubrobacterales bacterium]|nr:TlpA family protein disulfide reductase [Solirubrobacterales bacterium]
MVFRLSLALVAAAILVVGAAGCGGAQASSAAPPPSHVAAALKGSPPPLAALHAQANELLPGGRRAFLAVMARLRGYPVVVNKWASWCGPCQTEFPAFQKVAVSLGRQVAFLGLDGKDHDQAAAAFLRKFPVPYPSYVDPNEDIAGMIEAATYYPQTVYYNRAHKQVYDHAGPYTSAGALEQDVRRYAVNDR